MQYHLTYAAMAVNISELLLSVHIARTVAKMKAKTQMTIILSTWLSPMWYKATIWAIRKMVNVIARISRARRRRIKSSE